MKKINSKKSLSSYKTSSFELYLLIFPFVILFFLTTVLPVLSSIALSFFRYDMVSFPKICGLENYLRMFLQDDIFPVVLKNTFLLAILTGPSGFAFVDNKRIRTCHENVFFISFLRTDTCRQCNLYLAGCLFK